MTVRVRFNKLPRVINDLNGEVNDAVDDTAEVIGRMAQAAAPVRSGVLVRTTKSDAAGDMHAVVEAGIYRGRGFYAGFQEFGTSHHGPQPFMVPSAHAGEPVLVQKTTQAVRRACDV